MLKRTRNSANWRYSEDLDFTREFDELIVNLPIARALIRSFSDEPQPAARVVVYPLEEICAEKIRTLLQRTEPRDLYDVWRILSERADEMDVSRLAATLHAKYAHRGITLNRVGMVLALERVTKYANAWGHRLRDQIPKVPPLDTVVCETRRLLRTFLE